MVEQRTDILADNNVPPLIRWYASKCAQQNIAYSNYAGWDIYTRPAKLDGKFTSGNRKILSISDLYLTDNFIPDNYEIIASETRMRVCICISSGELTATKLIAPYITLSNWFCGSTEQVQANTIVLTTISDVPGLCANGNAPEKIYIMEVSYPMTHGFLYGGAKYKLGEGESYTTKSGGFNEWHAIAMGLYTESQAKEICMDTRMPHTTELRLAECLKSPPSQSIYTYPDIFPRLSSLDYSLILKNKSTAEICDALRVPFLYFYPNIDVSNIPYLLRLKEQTRRSILEMKEKKLPNCHL